ncbi:hypothetical protein [Alicyclobacillus herbarius]|uniref:hypothetical protein n=1 Tax=Alicyclobacillus herbarius TaxID=122960 RepID=UPI0004224667|nr:hypothetical protein [Alicyclobacillus herbarius]
MAEKMASFLWERLSRRIQSAIYAEQVFCSITTEMKFLPGFENQLELRSLHRENYETSYHLNTAAGNLARILAGAHDRHQERQLILMTVECFIEAREHMDKAEGYLGRLKPGNAKERVWLRAAGHWHQERVRWLNQAMRRLKTSIPESVWQEGVSLVER